MRSILSLCRPLHRARTRRSGLRAGIALLGAACLVGATIAPTLAQTNKPDVQWQRGIFSLLISAPVL